MSNIHSVSTIFHCSVDIRNMFNAVSRQKLREIISTQFPALEGFFDCLYATLGTTLLRCDDGNWIEIPVQQGFSQGCPLSLVLAAIVLNKILVEVDQTMKQAASDSAYIWMQT